VVVSRGSSSVYVIGDLEGKKPDTQEKGSFDRNSRSLDGPLEIRQLSQSRCPPAVEGNAMGETVLSCEPGNPSMKQSEVRGGIVLLRRSPPPADMRIFSPKTDVTSEFSYPAKAPRAGLFGDEGVTDASRKRLTNGQRS